jgi:hypothetical protein
MLIESVMAQPANRPSKNELPVTSYGSSYEHSLEHWVETRRLVEEADKEAERLFTANSSDSNGNKENC